MDASGTLAADLAPCAFPATAPGGVRLEVPDAHRIRVPSSGGTAVPTGERRPPVRRTTRVTAGLAAVLLLAACGTETDGGSTATPAPEESPTATESAGPPSGSVSESPSESPTEEPTAEPTTSGVYYVVDTRAGLRLAREMRELAGEDPAREAVEAMIAGPEDPDYASTWNPDTEVLGITVGDVIEVDLSEQARTANVGSEGAERMVQQLVYTVTEAVDRKAAVRLLVAGQPAGELWGAVSWEEPVRRAKPIDVRLMVQIDRPAEGAVTSSPVTVEGDANVFEANVLWRVNDRDGDEVESGFTMTRVGMRFSPYSFTVDLEPGTYTVEVSESDPSGGEGGEPMTDTKTFTVE